jgi:hypothetical protein
MFFADFSLSVIEKLIGTAIGIVISIASFGIGRWWGR